MAPASSRARASSGQRRSRTADSTTTPAVASSGHGIAVKSSRGIRNRHMLGTRRHGGVGIRKLLPSTRALMAYTVTAHQEAAIHTPGSTRLSSGGRGVAPVRHRAGRCMAWLMARSARRSAPSVRRTPASVCRLVASMAAQRVTGLGGLGVDDLAARPGLDRDHADGVRDHVVQLTGDPQPFGRDRRGLGLGAQRLGVQAVLADRLADQPRDDDGHRPAVGGKPLAPPVSPVAGQHAKRDDRGRDRDPARSGGRDEADGDTGRRDQKRRDRDCAVCGALAAAIAAASSRPRAGSGQRRSSTADSADGQPGPDENPARRAGPGATVARPAANSN